MCLPTPETFPLFSSLPPDLQLRIFDSALEPHLLLSELGYMHRFDLVHQIDQQGQFPILVGPLSSTKIFIERAFDEKRNAQEAIVRLMHVSHQARHQVLRTWRKDLAGKEHCYDLRDEVVGVLDELLDPNLPLQTFHRFPDLPEKLQVDILSLALLPRWTTDLLFLFRLVGDTDADELSEIRKQDLLPFLLGPISGQKIYVDTREMSSALPDDNMINILHINRDTRYALLREWEQEAKSISFFTRDSGEYVLSELRSLFSTSATPTLHQFPLLPPNLQTHILTLALQNSWHASEFSDVTSLCLEPPTVHPSYQGSFAQLLKPLLIGPISHTAIYISSSRLASNLRAQRHILALLHLNHSTRHLILAFWRRAICDSAKDVYTDTYTFPKRQVVTQVLDELSGRITVAAPTAFTSFPRLPLELRIRIAELALDEPWAFASLGKCCPITDDSIRIPEIFGVPILIGPRSGGALYVYSASDGQTAACEVVLGLMHVDKLFRRVVLGRWGRGVKVGYPTMEERELDVDRERETNTEALEAVDMARDVVEELLAQTREEEVDDGQCITAPTAGMAIEVGCW